MQRSVLKFDNAIKSTETRRIYNYYLNKFLIWSKIKEPDGLLQLKDTYLQTILEDYLFYLKKSLSPNSLTPIFAALELFFTMNDKVLNFKKLRKMFPERVKSSGRGYWETKDVQFMLKNIKSRRTRAIIHFLASTGCRIGALQDLKIKNLEDIEQGCKKVLFYEDTKEEYLGFLTPEANQALEEYFDERRKANEHFSPESPVFRASFHVGSAKGKPVKTNTIKMNLYRVIHRLMQRQKTGTRYNIQAEHGFRKRFATILKTNDHANISLVEKLLGHKGVVYLDGAYFNPNTKTLFEEFKKHILDLTIDPSERDRIKIATLEVALSEKEKLHDEIKRQRQAIDYLLSKDPDAKKSLNLS